MGEETIWRCEHLGTGPDHRDKLEDEEYVCEVYVEEKWLPFPTDSS